MKRILSSLALCMALIMQPAQADFVEDCNNILNGAQRAFKDIFPTAPDNLFLGPWCYRAYPGNVLAGISIGSIDFPPGVYAMNGPFGDEPNFIGPVDQTLAFLNSQPGGGQNEICDSSNSAVSGIETIQDGDHISITTNGKCVPIPTDSLCAVQAGTDEHGTPQITGISMFTETKLISYKISGFDIPTIPGFPDPLSPIVDSFESSSCIKNVPVEYKSGTKMDIDVCLDISPLLGNVPVISDNVTIEFIATSTSTAVDDCANTGADTIVDLVP